MSFVPDGRLVEPVAAVGVRRWGRLMAVVVVTAAVAATATGVLVARRYERRRYGPSVVTEVLRSSVLGERRRLLVHLPDSYRRERSRRYPVLYVLDGGRQDLHTAAAAEVLARLGSMPEVLVVGLMNEGDTRWRDYTPPYPTEEADAGERRPRQADRFLRYIETEAIPLVEGRYRTQPERMIAGHSLGGLFVLYSLFEKRDLFQARFAFSPSVWVAESRLRTELEKSLRSGPARASFLYLSLGEKEGQVMHTFERLVGVLRQFAPGDFRWRSRITPGAGHLENDVLSTPAALQAYYAPGVEPQAQPDRRQAP